MEDPARNQDRPPAEITHLVRERSEARAARDWQRADALKDEIEAAGWKVVDSGSRTSVHRAAPPDREVDGERRYGSRLTVPSRLTEPARPGVAVVAVASEEPDTLRALVEGLGRTAPAGTQLVVVVNDPSAAQEAALPDLATLAGATGHVETELVGTSTRLGFAAALNVGLQRVATEHIVVADATATPTGDALSPIAGALADPSVAIVGGFGLAATAPAFRPAALERTVERAVVAVELAWLGFRRSDYLTLGPLDEGFIIAPWLDVWWSFGLRSGDDPEIEPRTAVRLDLPLDRPRPRDWPPERTRMARRNSYRVIDTFAADRRLMSPTSRPTE